MIHFTETQADDIGSIKQQAEQNIGYGLTEAIDLGVSETMWAGDVPIAAYGIVSMWEGVATVWALLSDEATDTYPVALTRRVREMLDEMIDSMEIVRVQAEARVDHPAARNWLEGFGFEVEGTMACYGPEDHADYYLMARIMDGEVA